LLYSISAYHIRLCTSFVGHDSGGERRRAGGHGSNGEQVAAPRLWGQAPARPHPPPPGKGDKGKGTPFSSLVLGTNMQPSSWPSPTPSPTPQGDEEQSCPSRRGCSALPSVPRVVVGSGTATFHPWYRLHHPRLTAAWTLDWGAQVSLSHCRFRYISISMFPSVFWWGLNTRTWENIWYISSIFLCSEYWVVYLIEH
jgi:hypothetical protein